MICISNPQSHLIIYLFVFLSQIFLSHAIPFINFISRHFAFSFTHIFSLHSHPTTVTTTTLPATLLIPPKTSLTVLHLPLSPFTLINPTHLNPAIHNFPLSHFNSLSRARMYNKASIDPVPSHESRGKGREGGGGGLWRSYWRRGPPNAGSWLSSEQGCKLLVHDFPSIKAGRRQGGGISAKP